MKLMESRDLVTTIISIAAILISILAWRTAKAGYQLAQAQDQRALDREKPLLQIDMPSHYARGPLEIAYRVTNRGPEPIQVVGFRLPINIGRSPITERAPFRFSDSIDVERVIAKHEGNESGDYELTRVQANLEPGETHNGTLVIVPEPRDRVKLGTELRMHMDVVVRNREATTYSLSIFRKV